jgi:hypothetical protein
VRERVTERYFLRNSFVLLLKLKYSLLIYTERTKGIQMTVFYEDYVWKNGFPYGIRSMSENIKKDILFKIASDPYHKRVSIEKYYNGKFSSIIYDSALFDFRHLKFGEQLAWQKTSINESENQAICHIRNQDDRLVLIEEYRFEKNLCRECQAFSPFGVLISIQKISYKIFEDSFDGVTLFDNNNHKVMSKSYQFDEKKREFTMLLKEEWS